LGAIAPKSSLLKIGGFAFARFFAVNAGVDKY
jgi:hypothetical protein